MTLLGLISDTHGLLRPQAIAALKGVSHILHAGDIGGSEILSELRHLAPVTAIRGNVDYEDWALNLPVEITATFACHKVHIVHSDRWLGIQPDAEGISAVIYGHSHQPTIDKRDGVLYVNPGSAGPRRFTLPVSIGFLRLEKNAAPVAWLETLAV